LNVEAAATYHGVKMTVYRTAKLCCYQFRAVFALLLRTKWQLDFPKTHQTGWEWQEYKSTL